MGMNIKAIRERVEAWKGRKDKPTTVDSMAHALNDREDLLDALDRHGGHTAACYRHTYMNDEWDKLTSSEQAMVCDCGWEAFLTTHGASEEEVNDE